MFFPQLFHLISQSNYSYSGSSLFIILQVYISSFTEIKFLVSAFKNKPLLLKATISLIPLALLATYSIYCGMIYNNFLGKGLDVYEMKELLDLTLAETSILEIMISVAVFLALMALYSRIYKLRPIQWILTFGVELLAALSLVILYGGLFIDGFPFTVLALCNKDIYLAVWPVYAYFMILFKCVVLIVTLSFGWVLKDRIIKNEDDERYSSRSVYYEKKVLRYLVKYNLAIGISLLSFTTFTAAVLTVGLWLDSATVWDAKFIFMLLCIIVILALISSFSIKMIYRGLRPKTLDAYKQLLAMGDKETVFRLFCKEIADNTSLEGKQPIGTTEIRTSHFQLRQQGIDTWIEWTAPREHTDMTDII